MYSAKPPASTSAKTSSPGRNRVTSLPTASTSPGHVAPEDGDLSWFAQTRRHPHEVRIAAHHAPVSGIGASRPDPDQDLVVLDHRLVDLLEFQDIRRAVAREDDRFHRGHDSLSGYWKTSSSGTLKTRAIWKAISSDGGVAALLDGDDGLAGDADPIREVRLGHLAVREPERRMSLVTLVGFPMARSPGDRRRSSRSS